jgi:LacI family transcriptional regulator
VSVISDDVAHMIHFNDREAVTNIAEHFIALGHTEIGFIKGPENSKSAAERHDAFSDALEKNGVHLESNRTAFGANTFQSGVDCAVQLLKSENPPTAIFASNDEMAIGVMVTAQKMGINIPSELTIVGFDDTPQASKVWPALTTVNLQVKEMGKLATQKLLALCSNNIALAKTIKSELVPTEVQRDTTAPPPIPGG